MARGRSKDRALRLEKGTGDERVFWEIKQSKATITIRYGRHLGAGRTIKKAHASDAAARAAFDAAATEKMKEGYAEPVHRAAIGMESKKGVSLRNPELEAVIEEEGIDDPAGYVVYSDWLLEHGDPRAELITVQCKLAKHPSSMDLDRAETELFKRFEEELLGPLAKWTRIRQEQRYLRGLVWRYGFLRAARLRRVSEPTSLETMVTTLLEHPSGRFLERLALGRSAYGAARTTMEPTLDALVRLAPKTLSWLCIGDDLYEQEWSATTMDLAPVWSAVAKLPFLRTLVIACTTLGAKRPPTGLPIAQISSLVFQDIDPPALDSLMVKDGWPGCRDLFVTIRPGVSRDVATRSFAQLLEATPNLEQLTVRQWVEGRPPPDALALDVIHGAATKKIRRLDLEMPLSDRTALSLCDNAEARMIPELSLAIIDLPPSLRSRVTSALPRVVITGRPEERDLADLDELI